MSAINSALIGLETNSRAAARYADQVMRGTTLTPAAPDQTEDGLPADYITLGDDTMTVEQGLIGMITAEIGYKANAKIISAQRDMERELLNIFS